MITQFASKLYLRRITMKPVSPTNTFVAQVLNPFSVGIQWLASIFVLSLSNSEHSPDWYRRCGFVSNFLACVAPPAIRTIVTAKHLGIDVDWMDSAIMTFRYQVEQTSSSWLRIDNAREVHRTHSATCFARTLLLGASKHSTGEAMSNLGSRCPKHTVINTIVGYLAQMEQLSHSTSFHYYVFVLKSRSLSTLLVWTSKLIFVIAQSGMFVTASAQEHLLTTHLHSGCSLLLIQSRFFNTHRFLIVHNRA